jgi:recombinational DNA repair ATPase RecF
MAHITEFTVEGLAGRAEPYSHQLDRHVNVFFGLNGSGKTSLLKLLHAAMSKRGRVASDGSFQTRPDQDLFSGSQKGLYVHLRETGAARTH